MGKIALFEEKYNTENGELAPPPIGAARDTGHEITHTKSGLKIPDGPDYEYILGDDTNSAGRFHSMFKGRRCRIIRQSGRQLNLVLVSFTDNGEMLTTGLNALRKV